jgi:hypothetical protein
VTFCHIFCGNTQAPTQQPNFAAPPQGEKYEQHIPTKLLLSAEKLKNKLVVLHSAEALRSFLPRAIFGLPKK